MEVLRNIHELSCTLSLSHIRNLFLSKVTNLYFLFFLLPLISLKKVNCKCHHLLLIYIEYRKESHFKMSKNMHNHMLFFLFLLYNQLTLGSQFPISLHRFLFATFKEGGREREREKREILYRLYIYTSKRIK